MSQASTTEDSSTAGNAGGGGFELLVVDPYATMSYDDIIADVHTRFVLNLPDSELATADRIFFQLEQAWWFYEDLICDPRPQLDYLLRYHSLKPFAKMMFTYSPVLPDVTQFDAMWNEFSLYKRQISNYGCILTTADYSKVILCQIWNSKTHTFPAGKINQGEDGRLAAARETYEETGFDPSCNQGLTAVWKESCPEKITWNTTMEERDMLVHNEENGGKRRTCYVIVGVPEDFPFAPVARKEVAMVAWHPIDNLPKPSFAVIPFLNPLRIWIKKHKKMHGYRDKSVSSKSRDSGKHDKTTPNKSRNGSTSRNNSRGRNDSSRGRVVRRDDDLVAAGLASAGDTSGWSEEDMFLVNEQILGRKVEYDGNPHEFVEKGLSTNDPHAFRVVGGAFLNSGVGSLAPPPDHSRLQPLFSKEEKNSQQVQGLTPFFSDDGVTPWGEVVSEAKVDMPGERKGSRTKGKQQPKQTANTPDVEIDDGVFLTDRQITSKSQSTKTVGVVGTTSTVFKEQYERDMAYVREWVAKLPKPQPTKHFGTFRLDSDAIMAQAERDVPALKGGFM